MGKLETSRLIAQGSNVCAASKENEITPLVTVGIPNYNYAQYISEAIQSAAEQSYPNIELIIIDDCSSDDSVAVIQKWLEQDTGNRKIIFAKNKKNVGLTKACNQILTMASGKYIQFLDADDTILPDKIETQVSMLEKASQAAFVYSDVLLRNDNSTNGETSYLQNIGYDRNKMPSGKIHEQLFDFNFIPLPSVLVRSSFIKQAGGFDESLAVQDYYLWLKLTETHEAIYTRDYTAIYRVHKQSMSNNLKTSSRSLDSILRICFRYYSKGNKVIKSKIRHLLNHASPNLYKTAYPTASHWLKLDLLLNPGVRTFAYFIGCRLGVPYHFFGKLKSAFGNRLRSTDQ